MEVDKGKCTTLEHIQTDLEYLIHLTTHAQHLRNVLEIYATRYYICMCVHVHDSHLIETAIRCQ